MKKLNRIAKRLNPRLDGIKHFHDLTEAESFEFDWLNKLLKDVESSMTLTGTTERTIARKEAIFGVASEPGKPLSQRISVLVARFRGRKTTTPDIVKGVAISFEYGEIEVIDDDEEPYSVIVRFTSGIGAPPNVKDFKEALETIKPAHLVLKYEYNYLLIEDIHEAMTLEDLESQTLERFAF